MEWEGAFVCDFYLCVAELELSLTPPEENQQGWDVKLGVLKGAILPRAGCGYLFLLFQT